MSDEVLQRLNTAYRKGWITREWYEKRVAERIAELRKGRE